MGIITLHLTKENTSWLNKLSWLPWWLSGKESARNVGDLGLIPGLGRSPGEENGSSLWYSCLENSMNRGGWQATIHAKSQTKLRH